MIKLKIAFLLINKNLPKSLFQKSKFFRSNIEKKPVFLKNYGIPVYMKQKVKSKLKKIKKS